jgi:hypothetical protein
VEGLRKTSAYASELPYAAAAIPRVSQGGEQQGAKSPGEPSASCLLVARCGV